MPARIGDTRTPAQKEEYARKAVYHLLTEEFQSWGSLKRTAKVQSLSTATLAKHLKKFVETGIAIKKEEEVKGARLPRTFYRLTSTKPTYGQMTERDLYYLLKQEGPSLELSEEEEVAWDHMATGMKIFLYELAVFLNLACKVNKLEQAKESIESLLDVRLKDSIRHLVEIFYKYRKFEAHFTTYDIPIAELLEESIMIEAEEAAESWIPKDMMKQYGPGLPHPEITIGWTLLSSSSREEALRKINEEIEEIQSQSENQSKT